MLNEWNGFNDGVWTKEINVRNFIQKNYTLYEGDDSFLADVSQKTKKVWNKCEELLAEELKKGGVLDVETDIISGITNFAPGYIDKSKRIATCTDNHQHATQEEYGTLNFTQLFHFLNLLRYYY